MGWREADEYDRSIDEMLQRVLPTPEEYNEHLELLERCSSVPVDSLEVVVSFIDWKKRQIELYRELSKYERDSQITAEDLATYVT